MNQEQFETITGHFEKIEEGQFKLQVLVLETALFPILKRMRKRKISQKTKETIFFSYEENWFSKKTTDEKLFTFEKNSKINWIFGVPEEEKLSILKKLYNVLC